VQTLAWAGTALHTLEHQFCSHEHSEDRSEAEAEDNIVADALHICKQFVEADSIEADVEVENNIEVLLHICMQFVEVDSVACKLWNGGAGVACKLWNGGADVAGILVCGLGTCLHLLHRK